ncbi:MAG: dipeptidase [Oscillospiraceae bacterium]
MEYIDMHCDTLLDAFLKKSPDGIVKAPNQCIDFERMKGHIMAQFFAVFLLPRSSFERAGISGITDEEYISGMCRVFYDSLKADPSVRQALNADMIAENSAVGFPSAVLTMEDGRAVDGKLENLERFYSDGFRAIALTWNYPNCFGFPNSSDNAEMSRGLTAFGKDAVRYMQELGILVDVSHLSDGGFYDVAEICKKPFIASHSNSRELSPHQRNLTDDMIRVLAGHGGVTGLNFCPGFIESDINARKTSAAMIARHARHIADVGGIECLAIGTDFDGFRGELDISDCTHMELLFGEMKKLGFSEDDIEKTAYKNLLRVMQDTIK